MVKNGMVITKDHKVKATNGVIKMIGENELMAWLKLMGVEKKPQDELQQKYADIIEEINREKNKRQACRNLGLRADYFDVKLKKLGAKTIIEFGLEKL